MVTQTEMTSQQKIVLKEKQGQFEKELEGEILEQAGSPEKKDTVLLLWRDISMEIVQMDISAIREKLDRLS